MKRIAITNSYNSTNKYYEMAVKKVGGTPIGLPKIITEENVHSIMSGFDGIILTGGGDVNPLLYGREITYSKGIIHKRDKSELLLSRYVYEKEIPTLAICRGMQITNVAHFGTLFQDNEIEGHFNNHSFPKRKNQMVHPIKIVEGSVLRELFGERYEVNSIHHQSIDKIAKGFKLSAMAEDGCIEGIEGVKGIYICVQWHPERNGIIDDSQYLLFEKIVKGK